MPSLNVHHLVFRQILRIHVKCQLSHEQNLNGLSGPNKRPITSQGMFYEIKSNRMQVPLVSSFLCLLSPPTVRCVPRSSQSSTVLLMRIRTSQPNLTKMLASSSDTLDWIKKQFQCNLLVSLASLLFLKKLALYEFDQFKFNELG